jgi:hypothetical protein
MIIKTLSIVGPKAVSALTRNAKGFGRIAGETVIDASFSTTSKSGGLKLGNTLDFVTLVYVIAGSILNKLLGSSDVHNGVMTPGVSGFNHHWDNFVKMNLEPNFDFVSGSKAAALASVEGGAEGDQIISVPHLERLIPGIGGLLASTHEYRPVVAIDGSGILDTGSGFIKNLSFIHTGKIASRKVVFDVDAMADNKDTLLSLAALVGNILIRLSDIGNKTLLKDFLSEMSVLPRYSDKPINSITTPMGMVHIDGSPVSIEGPKGPSYDFFITPHSVVKLFNLLIIPQVGVDVLGRLKYSEWINGMLQTATSVFNSLNGRDLDATQVSAYLNIMRIVDSLSTIQRTATSL